MSMPHGETTGRSQPCSTCGLGPLPLHPTHPANFLVAVAGHEHDRVAPSRLHHKIAMVTPDDGAVIIGYPVFDNECGMTMMMVTALGAQVAGQWTRDGVDNPGNHLGCDGLSWDGRKDWQEAVMRHYDSAAAAQCGMPDHSAVWIPTWWVNEALALPHGPGVAGVQGVTPFGRQWYLVQNIVTEASDVIPYYWRAHSDPLDAVRLLDQEEEVIATVRANFPQWLLEGLPNHDKIKPMPEAPQLELVQRNHDKTDALLAAMAVPPELMKLPPLKMQRIGDLLREPLAVCKPGRGRAELVFGELAKANKPFAEMQKIPPEAYIHAMQPASPAPETQPTPCAVESIQLDSEEESEVWKAFSSYCNEGVSFEAMRGEDIERILERFVYLRKKLCRLTE